MEPFEKARRDVRFTHALDCAGVYPSLWIDNKLEHSAVTDITADGFLKEVTYSGYSFTECVNRVDTKFGIRGGCSCCQIGNYIVRNLDWLYDNTASIVVHVKPAPGRLASVGVAAVDKSLNKDYDFATDPDNIMPILPSLVVDGINSAGLFVAGLVHTPGDFAPCTGTNPGKRDLYALLVVRYLLDNAISIEHALQLLSQVNMYSTYTPEFNEDQHWLMSDNNRTVIVELINNVISVTPTNIVTNYPVFCDYSDLPDSSHPAGVERANIMKNASVTSLATAKQLAEDLAYTKAYTNTENIWWSELCGVWGEHDLNKAKLANASEQPEFIAAHLNMVAEYGKRDRNNPVTWITCHSVVIDRSDLSKIYVRSQEDSWNEITV